MPTPWIVSWTLVVTFGAAPAPDAGAVRDEDARRAEDRAFHHSSVEGTLTQPLPLRDLADLVKVCTPFLPPTGSDEKNAYQRGVERAARHKAKAELRRRIYTADFPVAGFRFADYDVKERSLPLELEKPLSGLDGALSLSVGDPEGGDFTLADAEAEAVAKRHQEKRLRLRVTFTFEDDRDEHPGGCFGHPKADAFTLIAYPLAYELLGEDGASLARTRTPRMERLRRWIDPGEATLRLEVSRRSGTLDEVGLQTAVEGARVALEACVASVKGSVAGTGLAAFDVEAQPNGAFKEPAVELDAFADPAVVPCLRQALQKVIVAKAQKPSRVQVRVAVDRSASAADD